MPGFKERVDLLHGNTTSVEHTESIENLDNSSAETAGTLAENDETTVSVQETNAEKEIKKAPAYNVIGGAFSVKENAVKFSNEMKNKGYANVKLIYNDQKGLYMVSLQQFNNINDAVNFKDEVRNASGISCWVYKK